MLVASLPFFKSDQHISNNSNKENQKECCCLNIEKYTLQHNSYTAHTLTSTMLPLIFPLY